jgi:hypothetical protein
LEAHRFRIDRIILVADADHLLKLLAKGLGISVGGEAHELRGIVDVEAEIAADHLPGEAERVWEIECFDRFDVLADALRQRRTGGLANAVNGEDGGAIEA